jgi:hypothetical protein
LHFDSVVELHPIDDLREPFEPAQSSPAALGAQTDLVDHREHSVAGQTSFRAIGPVAKLDSITFELRMWIILAP